MANNNLKHGITLAIPAAHEADNLKILLPVIIEKLKSLNLDYDILIVDRDKAKCLKDPDATPQVAEDFGAKYFNQEFPGLGGAIKTAVIHAEREKFLILDGDGSHNPEYIPEIYKKYIEDNCDVVIGSRYTKGGHTHDKLISIILSRILNFVFRIITGIKAHDISTNYRLYDTEQLKNIEITCPNYDVQQELLLRLKLNNKNLKIEEVPITFEKRIYGESKRQFLKFVIDYAKSMFTMSAIRVKHAFKNK